MFVGSLGRRWAKCAQALSLLLGLVAAPAFAQFAPSAPPEVFGGFSYFNPNARYLKTDTSNVASMSGWGTSIYTPFGNKAGAVFDVSGQYGAGGSFHSVLFGAEYKPKKWVLQPFGEVMMGWARRSPKNLPDQGAAAFAMGGGIDLRKDARFSIRLLRFDYIHSFDNPTYAGTSQQTFWNSMRIQSGVVMTVGGPPEASFVSAACTATPGTVRAGEPVSAKLTPKGFFRRRSLVYEWQVNDAKLGSTSAEAVIETAALTPGNYTVKGKASNNGKGKRYASAICTATFAVLEVPKQEAPAGAETQPATEPAKTESQPVTESATAKSESQPATETASTKPETKMADETPTATAQPAQPPATAEAATVATPEKPATTSSAQPSSSTRAAEAAPTSTTEQGPAQVAAPAQAPTSNAGQSAQPKQPAQQSSVEATKEASAKVRARRQGPATSTTAPAATDASKAKQPATAHRKAAVETAHAATPESALETKPATTVAEKPTTTTKIAKSSDRKRTGTTKPSVVARANTSTQPSVAQPPVEGPNQVAVVATPATVRSGEPATINVRTDTPTATPSDAVCTASGGTLRPNNGKLTLDTTGVPAGKVTVTCSERDGKPLGSTAVDVITASTNPADVRKLNSVKFHDVKRPARVDNVAKQILRDAAHALQQSEPGSKLILVGNARTSELESDKTLAQRRTDNAKAFLMDKQNGGGVDASSISVRTGKADARRVDIYLAAPGATLHRTVKSGGVATRAASKPVTRKAGIRRGEK